MIENRTNLNKQQLATLKKARNLAKKKFEENEWLRGEEARQYRRSLKNRLRGVHARISNILANDKPRSEILMKEIGLYNEAKRFQKTLQKCHDRIDLEDGRRSLESLRIAAKPLLDWYENNGFKVAGWRSSIGDEEIFSKAAIFLHEEFQLLLKDKRKREASAVTIIKNRLKLNKDGLPN